MMRWPTRNRPLLVQCEPSLLLVRTHVFSPLPWPCATHVRSSSFRCSRSTTYRRLAVLGCVMSAMASTLGVPPMRAAFCSAAAKTRSFSTPSSPQARCSAGASRFSAAGAKANSSKADSRSARRFIGGSYARTQEQGPSFSGREDAASRARPVGRSTRSEMRRPHPGLDAASAIWTSVFSSFIGPLSYCPRTVTLSPPKRFGGLSVTVHQRVHM